MSSKIIYQSTRPAGWPAPENTEIIVTARQEKSTVLLEWQRTDRERRGDVPVQVALEAAELRAIVDALESDE